jgi:hypothetical protein
MKFIPHSIWKCLFIIETSAIVDQMNLCSNAYVKYFTNPSFGAGVTLPILFGSTCRCVALCGLLDFR